jgi:hypothetical protein
MLDTLLSHALTSQRSRPLSVAVVILALFVPASLVVFVARPNLYGAVGLNGVIVLSVAISLPIVLLCYGIWYTPLSAVWRLQKMVAGQALLPPDMATALSDEDPLQWPCVLSGGWTANLVLFVIAAIAYYKPIRIGATFLFTAAILAGMWTLLFLASAVAYFLFERKWRERLAELAAAEAALAEVQDKLAARQPKTTL